MTTNSLFYSPTAEKRLGKLIAQISRILLAIAIAVMLIHTVIYLAYGIALIPFPFDYDQGEGHELNNAILFSQGDCPYCSPDEFPFYVSNYPPVFHLIMTPFVWLFGPQFWYGRLIVFLGTLITTTAIGWAVWRHGRWLSVSVLAALAFLASNYIYHIGPLLRQHLLMVMFETVAIVVLAPAFERNAKERRWRLLLGFGLLLIAGYTKQLAYTTCIAAALWVFLRNPRTAIIYSLGLGATAAAIFLGWHLVTDGYWTINLITSNQNPYITDQYTGLLIQFVRLHWPLLLMAAATILYELYRTRLSIYSIWFVISALSTIQAGKWGAGDSYFATTIVAMCILAGHFITRARRQSSPRTPLSTSATYTRRILTLIGLVLFVIYGLTAIKLPTSGPIFGPIASALNITPQAGHRYPLYDAAGWTVGYAVTGHHPSAQDYANGWKLVDLIRLTDGYVMTEDVGFMIQADRPVISNGVQLYNLWLNDEYDPTELITLIESHEFGLIVLRGRFYPEPVLIAIAEHYWLSETMPINGFDYELWRPKPDISFTHQAAEES